MVRFILILPIAVVLLAATCVTDVRQRGPGGPWTVDVLNDGDQPVTGVVFATVFDATGQRIATGFIRTCPGIIPAHGTGAAEARLLRSSVRDPARPFSAEFRAVASEEQVGTQTSDGLQTRITEWHDDERFVTIEVTNQSTAALGNVTVCATLRGRSGELLEVGHTELFPTILRPGEVQVIPLYFNSVTTHNITVFASGESECCKTVAMDPHDFDAQSSTVTTTPLGRILRVSGELTNHTEQDLTNVRIRAYLDGAPETSVDGAVACTTATVGRDAKVPVTFEIAVPSSISEPHLVVSAAEAKPAEALAPLQTHAMHEPLGAADFGWFVVGVSAQIDVPPSMSLTGSPCAALRNAHGNVVGSALLYQLLAQPPQPSDSLRGGLGLATEPVTSVDVIAYGRLRPPPLPPGRLRGAD